jgi:flagellar basal-body rod protein FlgB
MIWADVLNARLTLFIHLSLTMTLDDIPLFSMLKSRLGYLNERQSVISENVANSDTAGFTPRDLAPFTVADGASAGQLSMAPVSGNAAFMTATASQAPGSGSWKPQASPDSETRLDGNQVVLEEEMMKMTEARMNYETTIGLYQKSMSLIQLAIRAPGKAA